MVFSPATIRRILLIAFVCLLVIGLMIAWEGLYIGLIANPEQIADYHFGSESMVGTGGEKYKTAAAYVHSCVVAVSLYLAAAGLALFARSRLRHAGNSGSAV